jgi:hypothetical protein
MKKTCTSIAVAILLLQSQSEVSAQTLTGTALSVTGVTTDATVRATVNGRLKANSTSGGMWLSNIDDGFMGNNGSNIGFWTNGTNIGWNAFQINKATGNVGIGNIAPSAKLEVTGSTYINSDGAGLVIDAGGLKRVGLMKYASKAGGLWRASNVPFEIGRVTGTDVTAGLGATPAVDMFFGTNGNVGIGTITPDAKLTVAGNIKAREVEVRITAGADFVFAHDYQLPNLGEVEAFVKANKHLPGIQSEKDMQENGLNLNQMNIKLLQKVEELTLYVIELKKMNEAQQLQINQLLAKVK